MEKIIHRADKRGKGEYGWLTTRYSFSFADWYEPSRMGFGALRVINDDRIAPASGFGMHLHRDMEIITIVTKGTVTHEDNIGNKGIVPAGDVQVMSAGTGVTHSEYNRSPEEALELFQIWIEPKMHGVEPRYAQKSFGLEAKESGSTLLISPDSAEGSLPVHQDAYITYAVLDAVRPFMYQVKRLGNGVYVFILEGAAMVEGIQLGTRDALGVTNTDKVTASSQSAQVLLIEVPVNAFRP